MNYKDRPVTPDSPRNDMREAELGRELRERLAAVERHRYPFHAIVPMSVAMRYMLAPPSLISEG